jgi:hypothetical protein
MNNNEAWEMIFTENDILSTISRDGFYIISSKIINQYRESRLMAKIDYSANLPTIFKTHNLSILPLSRNEYVIGTFDIHYPICYPQNSKYYSKIDIPHELENIETINYKNIYSEASALNFAFNVGIIDNLLGERSWHSVSGRMSTGAFEFNIKNISSNDFYSFDVNKAQCEIDGGFESETYFAIIEAKKGQIDDFCVRQLYYPYRLWSSKIQKEVIPIIMTYSNDIFSFFIYKFEDKLNYNSIKLIAQKHFSIGFETVNFNDINELIFDIEVEQNSTNAPFPQADIFDRVVDMVNLLAEKNLTKEEITENYQFDGRQTDYYANAGIYLGLIERFYVGNRKPAFRLTNEVINILSDSHKNKVLYFISKILQDKIFNEAFKKIETGSLPSIDDIIAILKSNCISQSESVLKRRSQTVISWISWILNQIDQDE